MTMKLVKTAAALALGASLVTSAVVPADASAASKYKVSKGKLVVAKTGKVATGTYKGIYYVKGVKLTGLKGKVYYKAGKKASGTYKGAYYYKGAKKVTTGTYNKAYYVKGVKKVTTGLYGSTYYNAGKKATGTYKGAYYVNGAKKVTTGTYNKAYYVAGKKVVSTGTYKGAYYAAGKKVVTNGLYADKLYTAGALNKGYKLYDAKLFKDADLNKGLASFEEKVYNDAELAEGTFQFEGKEEAFEKGIKVGAKVASVEAVNGTTIEVKFNKAVDKAAAETLANYSIEGGSFATPTLSEDGRTVTLTFAYSAGVTEFKDATFVVLPLVTKADSEVKTNKFVTVVNYKDTVAPTVVAASSELATITSTTAENVTVKFSEPVQNTGIFYVNGTSVTATQATAKDELILNISSLNIKAGEALEIKLTNVKDIANNNITPNPVTVNTTVLAAETVAPVITSVTTIDDNKVIVTYSKEIATANTSVYLSDGTKQVGNAPTGAVVNPLDKKEVTYTFASLPLVADKLSATLVIPKEAVVDTKGNKFAADYSTSVLFAKDVTVPTVTETSFKDGKLVLTLSEETVLGAGTSVAFTKVNAATGNTAAAGTVTLTGANFTNNGKTVTVDTATLALTEGSYKVNFAADFAKDTSTAINSAKAYETSINVSAATAAEDKVAPSISAPLAIASATNQFTFTVTDALNDLDFVSILDKNNYTFAGKALPTGTTVTTTATASDVKTTVVTINIPATSIATNTTGMFTVTGLKDIKGNAVSTIETSNSVTLKEGVAPTVKAVTAYKADNTLLVTLSEDIDVTNLAETDFLVSVNGASATASVASIVKATGGDAGVGNYVLTLNSSTIGTTTTKVELTTLAQASIASMDNANNHLTAITTALAAVIK